MNKRTLFATVVMLLGNLIIAQNVRLSIEDRSGYMQHSIKSNYKEKAEFADGDNIIQIEGTGLKTQFGYTARYGKEKHALIIHKIDASGKEIAINKLENGERNFGPVPTESAEFDGRILLFYFRYTDKDSMNLFVSELDRGTLQLTSTMFLFSYEQRNSGLFGMGKESYRAITVLPSPDNTKLLVVIPGKKEEIFACVFETGMHLARKKVFQVEGGEGLEINSAFIDNTGNALIALSKDDYNTTFLGYKIVKKFLILTPSNTPKFIDMTSLGAETEFHDIRFAVSKDKSKLYLFGDYKGAIANAGIWLSEIKTSNFMIGKARLIPYPEDFMKRVYAIGFGFRHKSEYGLARTDYSLVEFANGDLAICGSPLASVDNTYTNASGQSRGMIMDYAGPVIVSFLNGKENAVFTMIPRHQNYGVGTTSVFLPYQDKLVVLYNDYEKNINGPLLPDGVHEKGGVKTSPLLLACGILKKDGTVETRKLLSDISSKNNFALNTSAANIVSEKKVLIPSTIMDKKTDDRKVGVVTVDE